MRRRRFLQDPHGEFANTSNPWQRREEQEAKEVTEMQKKKAWPSSETRKPMGTSMVSRLQHRLLRHME